MKALLIISFLFGSIWTDSTSVVDTISTALRSGNTSEINKYFANSVDVTILDYHDFLNKTSTIKKVNEFFNNKSVNSYKIIHEGKSKGRDSVYTIGTLSTNEGAFKIYMFITSKGGQHFIEEIKIEV